MWDELDSKITNLSYRRFPELSPGEQEAALDTGYKPKCWNEVAEELRPWFKCLCGDVKCHSRDGFRGVKFFPLEEQKRRYWMYSPYMRQQIDWKIHGTSRRAI